MVRVVLVNPKDSKNVGSVCRAMKTMGLTSLYIVGKADLDLNQAAALAIHAEDVLRGVVRCHNLKEAVEEASLVAGITRRRGKRRKYFSISPEELANKVAGQGGGLSALVFGNEISGLNDQDLSLCHLSVAISSSPLFPSLNLSHAVQIIAYQVFKALSAPSAVRYTPLSGRRLDSLMSVILTSLKNIGFFSKAGQEDMGIFLRDIIARAGLSGEEANRLETVFRKISGLIAKKEIFP